MSIYNVSTVDILTVLYYWYPISGFITGIQFGYMGILHNISFQPSTFNFGLYLGTLLWIYWQCIFHTVLGMILKIIEDENRNLKKVTSYLRRSSLSKGIIRFGRKGKLSPRYIVPFEILDRAGTISYCTVTKFVLVSKVFHILILQK